MIANDKNNKEMMMYLGKAYEIHTVQFEGLIGYYENKVSHMMYLKKELMSVLDKIENGQVFDAH